MWLNNILIVISSVSFRIIFQYVLCILFNSLLFSVLLSFSFLHLFGKIWPIAFIPNRINGSVWFIFWLHSSLVLAFVAYSYLRYSILCKAVYKFYFNWIIIATLNTLPHRNHWSSQFGLLSKPPIIIYCKEICNLPRNTQIEENMFKFKNHLKCI